MTKSGTRVCYTENRGCTLRGNRPLLRVRTKIKRIKRRGIRRGRRRIGRVVRDVMIQLENSKCCEGVTVIMGCRSKKTSDKKRSKDKKQKNKSVVNIEEPSASFLGHEVRHQGKGYKLVIALEHEGLKSIEMSEIKRGTNQSALVDNSRDLSFLINDTKENKKPKEIKESLCKGNIGAKPGKLSGSQAKRMEQILKRRPRKQLQEKPVPPQVIEVDDVAKRVMTEEPKVQGLDETKAFKPPQSSFSIPKKPSNNDSIKDIKPESDEKVPTSDDKKKAVEEMIAQGNSIFEVSEKNLLTIYR